MKNKLFIFVVLLTIVINPNNLQAANKYDKVIGKYLNYKKYQNMITKTYPTQKGTILVTPDKFKNLLPLGHVAIVINKNYVYEATSKGVVRGLNNWIRSKNRVFGLRVKNLSAKAHSDIVTKISKQLNKKYNYNFFNTKTRTKFYCSQLIWAAFYDQYKINLDTKLFGLAGKINGAIHPLELVLSRNSNIIYYHEKK